MTRRERMYRSMLRARGAYTRFTHHWAETLRMLSRLLYAVAVVASVGCLVALALYAGFDSSVVSYRHVKPWLRIVQAIFAFNIVFNLTLRFRSTVCETRAFKWVLDVALLLTLIPWAWPHPVNPWWPLFDSIVYSRFTTAGILGCYSAFYVCYAMIRGMGKHTNPSLLLSASFILFIAVGSALLMLPRCTVGGISPVDSIFVSTSAVCICGLTPIDVSTTFTPMGLCVIALMMQVGALGVMTFTSFFALFFSGNTSIYSQLMVKDMIYSKTINSLLPTLLYTLVFTLSVEALGAVAIYFSVVGGIDGYTTADYMIFSAFHSLSAFCNAGFSTLSHGLSNPQLMSGNQLVYLVVSALVIAGGIGFPILVNTKDALMTRLRGVYSRVRRRHVVRPLHLYDMNTRVVLVTSSLLFVFTVVMFWILENDNTLAGMPAYHKLVQSIFNAVTPRSAGFASVDPARFMPATLILVMFMMWIGAGSQSTAGGIKVNTFAAACLHLKATVMGRRRVTAFHRTISVASLSRAQAVISLSIVCYLLYAGVMLMLCPGLPARMVLFETLSALFTVGSSLGATSMLPSAAKLVLCTAMFIGRVGLLSLLAGLVGYRRPDNITLPEDNLIIN